MADRGPTPVVVALAGVPGAGKTTLARALIAQTHMSYVSRDDIRFAMFQPCEFTPEEKQASFAALALAVDATIRLGRSCVVEGMPFSREGELERVRDIAAQTRAHFLAFLLDLPQSVAMGRVGRESAHGVGRPDAKDRVPSLVESVAARMRVFPQWTRTLDATRPTAELVQEVLAAVPAPGEALPAP